MKGDNVKVRNAIEEYGYDFVIKAIDRAVDVKTAREMSKQRLGILPTVSQREGEARILRMATEMGVRLG